MMPVTPSVPNLFRMNQDAHPPAQMRSQSRAISISDFDCTSAFPTSRFKKVERQSRDFRIQVRFQISDSRKGEKSKSGLRFQISDFRLAQGREIEMEVSISDFRFQTRARERNRKREFHFNFGFRLQSRL